MIVLLTVSISLLSFWTKGLNWRRIKSRCDYIGDNEIMTVDVNLLKDGVLKGGDNQVEVDGNNCVEETWKTILMISYVEISREVNENNWYWYQLNWKVKYG